MESPAGVKVLAIANSVTGYVLERKLLALDVDLSCVHSAEEIAALRRVGKSFEVILLPEKLADDEWWSLWGELCLLSPRPSILVYARHPTFQLWTAVLDMGGYDVVSEPFGEREIQTAVLKAAEDFRERSRSDPSQL